MQDKKFSNDMLPISPFELFRDLPELWHPKIIGQVNDQYLKIARIEGEFVWHRHADEDELFWVLRGEMRMDFEQGSVPIKEGEFLVVPRGTMHRPAADKECLILLIETVSTRHTGDEITVRTVEIAEQM